MLWLWLLVVLVLELLWWWVERHEKSLIWSLQVLNLTCLERVYNWFLITTLIIILTPGTISKHPGPTWHGTNWYHLIPPNTTLYDLAPPGTISNHPGPWTILYPLGLFEFHIEQ